MFGGGLAEDVDPVMVAGDGTITASTYPQTKEFNGGFTVLDLPSREAAQEWAAATWVRICQIFWLRKARAIELTPGGVSRTIPRRTGAGSPDVCSACSRIAIITTWAASLHGSGTSLTRLVLLDALR